jgi:hypothetical protein
LFLFDANTAGSGKTLLCDIISIVGTGRCVGRTTYPSSEEEMDKVTLAMALNGTKLILFDNTATGSPIGGAALDAALTATTRSGRQLGVSRFVTDIPFSPTFLATGNNAGLRGDTLRRVVSARLEATEDRPEERDGFVIPQPARVRPGTPGGTGHGRIDDPSSVHRRGPTAPRPEAAADGRVRGVGELGAPRCALGDGA